MINTALNIAQGPKCRHKPGFKALLLCPLLLLGFTLGTQLATAAGVPGFSSRMLAHVMNEYGAHAHARVLEWEALIRDARKIPETEKLERVNRFFNQLAFVNDLDHWGASDYWATPLELISTHGGDCEDFAIAKYFTLRHLGVPESRMRITYVQSLALPSSHMVLAYYPSVRAKPLILDNLRHEIIAGFKRRGLQPIYSFNAKGIFVDLNHGMGRRVGRASRLRLWREVNARVAQENKGYSTSTILAENAPTRN